MSTLTDHEKLEQRRKASIIFTKNRRKILKMVPPEQKRAYLKACDDAWARGEQCPPWPFAKVSSIVEL